jgi:phosphoglycolate phosphatase
MPFLSPYPCRLFLFDLDGTLIDSKLDIARALNLTLERLKFPHLPISRIAEFVGDGVQVLLERSLRAVSGVGPDSHQVQAAIPIFKEEYAEHLMDTTRLCEGASEALDRLSGAMLGVISNKPEEFSRRILDALGVGDRFLTVLGGDSTPKRKPAPDPLLIAMTQCHATPSETVMIGDSPMDIVAGKAAGTKTCGITGGFRGREELEAARADIIITNLVELADFFRPAEDDRK